MLTAKDVEYFSHALIRQFELNLKSIQCTLPVIDLLSRCLGSLCILDIKALLDEHLAKLFPHYVGHLLTLLIAPFLPRSFQNPTQCPLSLVTSWAD